MADKENKTEEKQNQDPTALSEQTAGNEFMHVKVYSPFKTYFDGNAKSISGENLTGPFDILPRHHNFMTLLDACELIIRTDSDESKVRITRGIMHVKADQVSVFLDV